MKISVTQQHIEAAEIFRSTPKVRSNSCAVALALHDAGFPEAIVGLVFIRLNGEDGTKIKLSSAVGQFVIDSDSRRPVKPFEFDLEMPA